MLERTPDPAQTTETVKDSCIVQDARTRRALIVKVNARELGLDLTELRDAAARVVPLNRFRASGMPTQARTFGFKPRVVIRDDYCSMSQLAREQPREHDILCENAVLMTGVYNAASPGLLAQHEATTQKVLPEYRMNGTPFTSGILNRDYAIRYHYDRGNFPGLWSAMVVFKKAYGGGLLVCPELDMTFTLEDGTLFFFDGQNIMHGVTPLTRLRKSDRLGAGTEPVDAKTPDPNAFRISIVYYSLYQMWKCETLEDELKRIQTKRTEREVRRSVTKSKLDTGKTDRSKQSTPGELKIGFKPKVTPV